MTPNLVNKDAILNGSFTNGYHELNGIHDDAEIFNGSFANGYNELDDSIHNDGEIPNESFINGHRESNRIQSNGQIFNESLTNGHNELNGIHGESFLAERGFGTRAIHIGQDPDPYTGAVIPPISLSTTFKQSSIGARKVHIRLSLEINTILVLKFLIFLFLIGLRIF